MTQADVDGLINNIFKAFGVCSQNPKWIINPGKQKMQMTALQM